MSDRYRFPSRCLFLFFALVLSSVQAPAQSRKTASAAAVPLQAALNPDGTLRPGSRGTFDARNYRLGTDPASGQPTFRPAAAGDENWDGRFGAGGANGGVYAVVVAPTGDVYIGGAFTAVGGARNANRVARWSGAGWKALGPGLNDEVSTLALAPNGDLIAGGRFTQAGALAVNHVARWNGTAWQPLGAGLNRDVYALDVAPNGDVVAGGSFNNVGGNPAADYLARWDGTAWQAMGTGILSYVYALQVLPTGDVVVGGDFDGVAGVAGTGYIARWDGTAWHPLGTGLNRAVNVLLALPNGDVLVGGRFDDAGGNPDADFLARWDGTAWGPYGAPLESGGRTGFDQPLIGSVRALDLTANGDLLIGGSFANVAGNLDADMVARWDGTRWQSLGGGLKSVVPAVAELPGGDVLAGGVFLDAGGSGLLDRLARWDGTAWRGLGAGLGPDIASDAVQALLVLPNGDVIASGLFQNAGGTPAADYIARWDGAAWQPLGAGLAGAVVSLFLAANGDVLAGGNFSDAGGDPAADGVARWDGTRWRAVGPGVVWGIVHAVAEGPDGEVWIGGDFSRVGNDVTICGVARWTGGAWQAVGTGLLTSGGGSVYDLLVAPNGDVLAGGLFRRMGGVPNADMVARWDGTAWHPLGPGLNNTVHALARGAGGDLYATGTFTDAGGDPAADGVARWDGTAWHPLGTGLSRNARGYALAVAPNGDVVVGGIFTLAGGVAGTAHIARWDGTAWHPLGSGLDNYVIAVAAPASGDVVAGGRFLATGDGATGLGQFGFYRRPAAAPTLTAVAPGPGAVGRAVTLTGTNFTGATAVTFGGTHDNVVRSGFAVNAAGTELRGVVVPAGAATGLVTVTGPAGTSNAVRFAIGTPTAAAPARPRALGLYPNPAREAFELALPAGLGPGTLTLYGATGQAVRTAAVAADAVGVTVSVRGLAPGLYVVRVQGITGTASARVVVE
ncbi:T9SS type A sorting domain-containing protein [Hymenobacter sp. BT683]|uniref:T9SS type A sorting domain-containing protein n=1 Tax=Hymenobacter jeongseonensis TaxID=2791027 RepID=A0ABS0IN50_9BACT|nr:T9SS type A sorting domain-containing protein [Hymenobacter jeongseonensis]MBF9239805.1 T9SS type A sorting domain-containing protein [Hymenobacter jeongseonensis]